MVKIELIESNDESEGYSDDSVEPDDFDPAAPEPEDDEEEGDSDGLPDVEADDLGTKVDLTDLAAVKSRIESICGLLSNWSSASKAEAITKERGAYLKELQDMVSAYYGYSDELAEYFLKLFSPTEAIQFFEANERPLPMTLRVNTLKTRRKELAAALIARGANVDPVGNWSKEGLVVHSSQVPIGATPEYLAGHYMMQSAASLIPVLALGAREGEKVLDVAAAPGGKATHIAQTMNNGGILYANDFNKERCTALVANIHRLGITNTIVTNYNGLDLKGVLPPVDRVLCDAPCSGLGVISKDPSVKVKRTIMDLKQNADLQKRLLLACIDMVKVNAKNGNCVVYSTCSISVEENEQVVDYALKMRDVKLVPLGVDVGSPALSNFRGRHFHPSIGKHARRFYPHLHNLDGFFVAKLVKLSSKVPTLTKRHREWRPRDSDASEHAPKVQKVDDETAPRPSKAALATGKRVKTKLAPSSQLKDTATGAETKVTSKVASKVNPKAKVVKSTTKPTKTTRATKRDTQPTEPEPKRAPTSKRGTKGKPEDATRKTKQVKTKLKTIKGKSKVTKRTKSASRGKR